MREGVLNAPVQALYADEMVKKCPDVYEDIIYLQEHQAEEAVAIFKREQGGGCEGLLQHLSKWHNPGEHQLSHTLGGGKHAEKFEIGGYHLAIDTWLPYVSLQYKVEGER